MKNIPVSGSGPSKDLDKFWAPFQNFSSYYGRTWLKVKSDAHCPVDHEETPAMSLV